MFFLTPEIGWAVGANGAIIETSNGGENWEIVGSGLTTSLLRGIHFTSQSNGYAVGNQKTLLKYTELSGTGNKWVETLIFDVYPNPASNRIEFIRSEFLTKNCIIEIHDLDGKTLTEKQMKSEQEKIGIDVSHLQSGIYLCTMKTDKKRMTKKIIIE